MMFLPVIVGVCRKSRGGGDGGQPTQEQGQGLGTGPGDRSGGGHRGRV